MQNTSARPARLSSDELVATYDRLALLYEAWGPLFGAEAHRLVQRRAALRNGEAYLEVAVGAGFTFLPMTLANPEGRNEGVDLSEGMLARCRQRLYRAGARNYNLQRADARELPFPDQSFDVALCCYLLDELSPADQARTLRELHRVLRRGGRLLVTNVTYGGLPLYELLARRLPWVLGGARPVNLAPQLLEQGFKDVSRTTYRRLRLASEVIRAVKI